MEYLRDEKKIILNRELSNLDMFVLKFIRVVEKYVDYVIMSGYVSIILGRSRATEDVDLFIKKMDKKGFVRMYSDLIDKGFWCLNTSNVDEMFDYLDNGFAIRFAEKGKAIPNFEVKFPKSRIDDETFLDSVLVKTKQGNVLISSLERQVVFKRYYLGSEKDEEDALHIEEVFKGEIDYDKINELKNRIKNEKQS